jgi:hypothetical protein
MGPPLRKHLRLFVLRGIVRLQDTFQALDHPETHVRATREAQRHGWTYRVDLLKTVFRATICGRNPNVRNGCGAAKRHHSTGDRLSVRQCLVWVKSVLVPGRQDHQWKHEPCLYGWADGAAHTWLSDRARTTALEFDKPARSTNHPTMKPVELFAHLIGNSCKPGGTVLDPFARSGTALVAAEQTGLTAYLLELDPRYADVVVRRFETFTGVQAKRLET